MAAHAVYDAVLGVGNALKQVMSSAFNANVNVIAGSASGAPDPSDYFIEETMPVAAFETFDVAGGLGILSITAGLYVAAGTITVPWNQRTNGGTFASGSAHFRINGTDALIVPTTISANQGDEGVGMGIAVHFLSTTGFAVPVTLSTAQALASQSFNAQYAFGPAYYGGSNVPECVGWAVNPGIVVEKSTTDGGIYPTRAYIVLRRPTIDLIFEDFDALSSFGVMHGAMTSAAVYGRKRSGSSTFVADATAEHLKFSFANGVSSTETIQATGVNRGKLALRLHGEALTASAASAIP